MENPQQTRLGLSSAIIAKQIAMLGGSMLVTEAPNVPQM